MRAAPSWWKLALQNEVAFFHFAVDFPKDRLYIGNSLWRKASLGPCDGPLAQWVEQLTLNQEVRGSSP
jgi:hypothetical protein